MVIFFWRVQPAMTGVKMPLICGLTQKTKGAGVPEVGLNEMSCFIMRMVVEERSWVH